MRPASTSKVVHVDLDDFFVYDKLLGKDYQLKNKSIYDQAVPKLLEVFSELGVKSCLFVVGADLGPSSQKNVKVLKFAISQGHEIGNHSYSHPSRFLSLSYTERLSELVRAHRSIHDALGVTAKSFRAPGYAGCWDNLTALESLDYEADYSRLPALYSTSLDFLFRLKADREKSLPSFLRPSSMSWLLNSNRRFNKVKQIKSFKNPIWGLPYSSTLLFKFPWLLRHMKSNWENNSSPFLFHAIDFLDYHNSKSRIPSFQIPFETRLHLIHILLSTDMR